MGSKRPSPLVPNLTEHDITYGGGVYADGLRKNPTSDPNHGAFSYVRLLIGASIASVSTIRVTISSPPPIAVTGQFTCGCDVISRPPMRIGKLVETLLPLQVALEDSTPSAPIPAVQKRAIRRSHRRWRRTGVQGRRNQRPVARLAEDPHLSASAPGEPSLSRKAHTARHTAGFTRPQAAFVRSLEARR
jgi:hypothetical protein